MDNKKTFKTNNFGKFGPWFKRLFFVGLFGWIAYIKMFSTFGFSNLGMSIYIFSLLLLVIVGQIDELEINNSQIIVRQNSIIPFLRSTRTYQIEEIVNIKKNSNYIEGEGFGSFILKKRKAVEIIFKDNSSEIINCKLHPKGYKGLVREIEKQIRELNSQPMLNGKV